MRNMSFAMTTEQVKARTKIVTRRFGWWFLNPGDKVQAVVKSMGLKKGQKVERLAVIEIVSTRAERLDEITKEDCIKEGFPEFEPSDFVQMICDHYKQDSKRVINRIEFKYV